MLPVICSFWHGDLDWLGRLCIASYVEKGHRFELYSYADAGRLPNGCVLRDANTVIPQSEMFFYKGSRTPAVFADLFRLRLMEREAGVWVDCDCYCIKPYDSLGEYIFGIESRANGVNNAVFRCPPDTQLLRDLLAVFNPGAIPPGLPWNRVLEVRLRRLLGREMRIEDLQFGATGPWPLTHHLRRLSLYDLAQPKPIFYPLDYGDAKRLMEPGSDIASWTSPESLSAHFWYSSLTARGRGRLATPEPGSFFARELERLGPALGA